MDLDNVIPHLNSSQTHIPSLVTRLCVLLKILQDQFALFNILGHVVFCWGVAGIPEPTPLEKTVSPAPSS